MALALAPLFLALTGGARAAPPAPPVNVRAVLAPEGGIGLYWVNSRVNTDGTPLSDFGGVHIYRNNFTLVVITRNHVTGQLPTAYLDASAPDSCFYELSTFDARQPNTEGPRSAPVVRPAAQPDILFGDFLLTAHWSVGIPPRRIDVRIANGGFAALDLRVGADVPWVVAEPAAMRIPPFGSQFVTLSADGTGLSDGDHMAKVFLDSTDPDTPRLTALLKLEIGVPRLAVDSTSFALEATGSGPGTSATRRMENAGAGLLSVTASVHQDWLQVAPAHVELGPGESATWTARAEPGSLARGSYTDTLRLVTNDPAQASILIPVRFSVVASPPTADITPSHLSFERWTTSPPSGGQLTLVNAGQETLYAAIAEHSTWLATSRQRVVLPGGADTRLDVTVDVAGLTPGDYVDTLAVTSNAPASPTRSIPVVLRVGLPGRVLSVRPASFDTLLVMNQPPLVLKLSLGNLSPDDLDWSLTGAPAWATFEPSQGTLPPQERLNSIRLRLSSQDLPAGNYAATIQLHAAGSSPADIALPIHVRVAAPSPVVVTPDTVRFRAGRNTIGAAIFSLRNAGTTPVDFSLRGPNWLTFKPASGRMAARGALDIRATFDSRRFSPPHTEDFTIQLLSADAPLEIPVHLEVVNGELQFECFHSRVVRRMTDRPDTAHCTVRNVGLVRTTGLAYSYANWLRFGTNGISFDLPPGGKVDLPVVVDPTVFDRPGDYFTGLIFVEAHAFSWTEFAWPWLRLLGPPPVIAVSPASLVFHRRVGDPPESLPLRVSNDGYEPLSATLCEAGPWLKLPSRCGILATRDTPAYFLPGADPSGLAPGIYRDVLVVSSDDPVHRTVTVPVELVVEEATAPVPPTGLALEELVLQSFGHGDSLQFIELTVLPGVVTYASPTLSLQATDRWGRIILDARDLFAGAGEGRLLPAGQSWLLADAAFQRLTGLAPDLELPLHLDPLGGVVTLLDRAVTPPAVLQRFPYGWAGGANAPQPGGGLRLRPDGAMEPRVTALPRNAVGRQIVGVPAVCPLDTLEAGPLRRVTSAASDRLEFPAGVTFGNVAGYDKLLREFYTSATNGSARLVFTETFVVTGLRAGEELTFDARLTTGSSLSGLRGATARDRLTWSLREPGTVGVTRESHHEGPSSLSNLPVGQINLPLRRRALEAFTLQVALSAEAEDAGTATRANLSFAGLPPGVTIRSCGDPGPPDVVPLAPAASIVSVQPGRVRVAWSGAAELRGARLERRAMEADWQLLANVSPDADGRIAYEDTDVTPGGHYAYRLVANGEPTTPVEVDVPAVGAADALTLRLPARLSMGRVLPLDIEVPRPEPGTLELFDLLGRRVTGEAVSFPTAGRQTFSWELRQELTSGLYFVRLTQRERTVVARTIVVR